MSNAATTNFSKLTPREKQIALFIAEGLSTKDIADKLGIKLNTVSTFKHRIFLKLDVDSVVGLYRLLKD